MSTSTYWSASLQRAATASDGEERPRIDALLEATESLLAAIQLTGVRPHASAQASWDDIVARVKAAVNGFKTPAPPDSLHYQDREWARTGKIGTHRCTDANGAAGEIHHEYEALDGEGRRTGARIWRAPSGHIYTED